MYHWRSRARPSRSAPGCLISNNLTLSSARRKWWRSASVTKHGFSRPARGRTYAGDMARPWCAFARFGSIVIAATASNVCRETIGMDKPFDLVIKNARIVRPNKTSVDCLDIAVRNGKIDRIAPDIRAEQGKEIFDARNYLAFPGCVDAHMHVGIYQPLAQDAVSESKAAAM